MMYVSYAFRTFLQLAFTLVAYILAPVLPLFASKDGWLPNWLTWFQTQDASLDEGWHGGYFQSVEDAAPTGFALHWMRTRWLLRNPAYGFCYYPLGIIYCPEDWNIIMLTFAAPGGPITHLFAVTTDKRYFAYTDADGSKYGYKLWWAIDSSGKLMPKLPLANRIPICFTPSLRSKK